MPPPPPSAENTSRSRNALGLCLAVSDLPLFRNKTKTELCKHIYTKKTLPSSFSPFETRQPSPLLSPPLPSDSTQDSKSLGRLFFPSCLLETSCLGFHIGIYPSLQQTARLQKRRLETSIDLHLTTIAPASRSLTAGAAGCLAPSGSVRNASETWDHRPHSSCGAGIHTYFTRNTRQPHMNMRTTML